MEQTLVDFFSVGRNLRIRQMNGAIMFVAPGHCLKQVMHYCIRLVSVPLFSCSCILSALEHLPSNPKCIILDLDEIPDVDVIPFFQQVDKESPCTISVVLTSNTELANHISKMVPRITTIVKGEGLESMLLKMIPELERGVLCRQ